ncbi:DUF4258 domain-containing protein [candidate division WOR-3 bacterium]|nr:DUF4258 domain-containing protein [candidate division WOR-3 bacterium]
MKPIRFSRHARENMGFRGASDAEVTEAIQTSPWQPAERGRQECLKEFPFGREWNGRGYSRKQVRPVFVEEPDSIVVVTVYVYYVP